MKKVKVWVVLLILAAVFILLLPLFIKRGAEFGGSDGAGSVMVEEISGGYKPWAVPILETVIGGGLPGEVETLFFCLQTAIGVGVLAFCLGRMVERKKHESSSL